MPYEIEIAPLAKLEILDAQDWYESGRKGLGDEFLEELEIFFDQLLINPKHTPIIKSQYEAVYCTGFLIL